MNANSATETEDAGQVPDQAAQGENQEPQSPSEKYLASVWAEFIGLEPNQILRRHKFIEIGGNSLTLNIILNRIEADTGASLAAELFFDDARSSLSSLARELDILRAGATS